MIEDTNRAKVILLGLFIIGLLLGYFLFQRIIVSRRATDNQKIQAIASIKPSFASSLPVVVSPTPKPNVNPSPTPTSAPSVTTKGGIASKSLPQTGAEEDLLAVLALSIVIAGYSIFRYYPN